MSQQHLEMHHAKGWGGGRCWKGKFAAVMGDQDLGPEKEAEEAASRGPHLTPAVGLCSEATGGL